MIDLRLKIDALPIDAPIVVRLRDDPKSADSPYDAVLMEQNDQIREYDVSGFSLRIHAHRDTKLDGDVLLIGPGKSSAQRLIRADSKHNTFLVTEQCDQLCVMCSQPPKKHHVDVFDQLLIAATLAPLDARITVSGGEPLLHKSRLFNLLAQACEARPDLRFHVLTNGQFFEPSDITTLDDIGLDRVLWGIPLYAPEAAVHDQIVNKAGAFDVLQGNLSLLMRVGASVELRTVVTQQNWELLPALADYVSTRLPFIDVWALMQMENIGYARMNWARIFKDTSLEFGALRSAINLATGRGIPTLLYNFPLCSIPYSYRRLAPQTISDWKNKFLDICDGCQLRSTCGGFFEWYKHPQGFGGLAPQ